ncbi:hypothetical protein D9599_18180 [Roseomonas sp. KE2513]|nr:hypothetical protein [Roseomonas sp. KE2513]
MTDTQPPDAVKSAVAELWGLPPPGPDNLFSSPEFVRLKEALQSLYPEVGKPVFALGTALRSLGLPCGLPRNQQHLSLPPDEAARRLDLGLRVRHARRWHLAPLDLADDLPSLRFGPAELRRFSADELRTLVDAPGLARALPGALFEAERFAEFQWLVVEEDVSLDRPPEARAVPVLFTDMGQDFRRIEPHKGRFPLAVEDALFFLLLAPWEDWSRMPEVDWRGFRVPWVYTIDEDLFVRPQAPPSPESLSWEPLALTDAWGEIVEAERPVVLPLEDQAEASLSDWNEAAWESVCRARQSPLFQTPVAHFFARAYLHDGVDEFLSHITAIEAAVGVPADHDRKLRAKPEKGLGATKRIAARVAALTGTRSLADQYEQLFRVRSAFLHGRSMGAISTAERVLARNLARQVVAALIEQANATVSGSREDQLAALLDRGLQLS